MRFLRRQCAGTICLAADAFFSSHFAAGARARGRRRAGGRTVVELLWAVADDADGADGAGGAPPMLAVALDGAHAMAGHDGGDGPGEARRAGAREKDAIVVGRSDP